MQRNQVLIVAIIAVTMVAICALGTVVILRLTSAPEPTAPPAATTAIATEPTFTPTAGAAGDVSWERVQAAGKIVVGTSADYPPFEFITEAGTVDGFDIALMNEIGRRLDLPVEYHDLAFDGLGQALQLGQIDAAIAGISVTEERKAFLDFSNIYFVGEDGILAPTGSSITSIDTIGDLSNLRIGVERGTVYETWLQTNLVDAGQLPSTNLLEYDTARDAVRDLRQNRLELVMMDALPAEVFASEGGVTVVGRGLNQQRFAVAAPKGAASLLNQINRSLTDLQNGGVIAALAKEYLDLDPDDLLPTPTPTPSPAVTSAPPPPPACLDGLALVQHLSYDDKNMTAPALMKPGQPFTKGWRVRNTGTCPWDGDYLVDFASGNDPAARMGGGPVAVQGQVPPGATYDIQVNLVAPLQPGTYRAFWQMQDGQAELFGERLPVGIQVQAYPTATPAPTQTPVPGVSFWVDDDQIKAGECTTFHWSAENVKAVYFYPDGADWQQYGVVGEGSQAVCPAFTTAYNLRVVYRDNTVHSQQITVYVEPADQAPQITRFTVDPPNRITLGQCVDIRWEVQGSVNEVDIKANGAIIWGDAPFSGSVQDCPAASGKVDYVIEAMGPGGTSRQQQPIKVHGEATATPEPPPPPDQPVIYSFAVQPEQIPLGACVNITWSTGGGTSWVTIVRDEDIVWDNAPLSGTVQDCPGEPGQYGYRIVAFNPQDQRVRQDRTVTVSGAQPR